MCKKIYNDLKFRVNEDIINFTKEKANDMSVEIDDMLLNHLGFLFVRDPLVIFEDKISIDDNEFTNHFEVFEKHYLVNNSMIIEFAKH